MNIEFLKSDDNRRLPETIDFITQAFSDSGIKIRIRADEVYCGSSLTYYPYDILAGREKIERANSKKTGNLRLCIERCFGGVELNGCVRIHQNGLEVPNVQRRPPSFERLLQTEGWRSAVANRNCIPILMGESVSGDAFVCQLSHAPDAYAVQMLVGGGLGSGMTTLFENVITALHTCRTSDELEIHILHRSLGYFAFKDSKLVAQDVMANEVAAALKFMEFIDDLVKNRLAEIGRNENVNLKDVLVVLDDYDDYESSDHDKFIALKHLVEKCVMCGRSAKVHFMVGVNDAREKILNTDIFTTCFSLHYVSSDCSQRIIGCDCAVKLKKGGEGLYRTGDFCRRVLIPFLSTEDRKMFASRSIKEHVPAVDVEKGSKKVVRSEKTKKLVSELNSLLSEAKRKQDQLQNMEAMQHKAMEGFMAMIKTASHGSETPDKAQTVNAGKKSSDQIELLPIVNARPKGILSWFLGPQTAEECFNYAASCYNRKHFPRSLKWFRKSADKGCVEGQYRAGWILAWGDEGVRQDGRAAERYLKCAAESGHADAMIQLAFLYEDGRGIKKNRECALHWFKMAAARGEWAGKEGVKRLQNGPVVMAKKQHPHKDEEDEVVSSGLRQHFFDQGLRVGVMISSVERFPCRRHCIIYGADDAERVFTIVASFFIKDRATIWKPVEPEEKGSIAFDYVLPSASIEDKQIMQLELEELLVGVGDRRLIMPEQTDGTDQVYAPLRYEYYDAIESGEKTVEYREYKDSWAKKLLSRPMKTIKFSRGYGQSGKTPRQMVYAIEKIGIVDAHTETEIPARHPDGTLVCDGDVDEGFVPTHFAIHLGARLS